MGYMRAHTMVVESWDEAKITTAHAEATKIFPWVSGISPKAFNMYRSFFIPPDGSKEGWDESLIGDDRRATFKAWLRTQEYKDGSTSLRWVEVQFADDNDESLVVDHDGSRRTETPSE